MKTIKTNNAELLLVKVPRDGADEMLIVGEWTLFRGVKIHIPINGFGKQYLYSKLTKEQAKELGYTLAEFHSLMVVNEVYLSNPFEKPDMYDYQDDDCSMNQVEYEADLNKWQKAENNTSEYLILIKK